MSLLAGFVELMPLTYGANMWSVLWMTIRHVKNSTWDGQLASSPWGIYQNSPQIYARKSTKLAFCSCAELISKAYKPPRHPFESQTLMELHDVYGHVDLSVIAQGMRIWQKLETTTPSFRIPNLNGTSWCLRPCWFKHNSPRNENMTETGRWRNDFDFLVQSNENMEKLFSVLRVNYLVFFCLVCGQYV